jgi:hypothetical protein
MKIGLLPKLFIPKGIWKWVSCPIFFFLKEPKDQVIVQFSFTKQISRLFLAWAFKKIRWPLDFPLPKKRTWESGDCLIFLFLKEHENWAVQFSSTKKKVFFPRQWGKSSGHPILLFLKELEKFYKKNFKFVFCFFTLGSLENHVGTWLLSF